MATTCSTVSNSSTAIITVFIMEITESIADNRRRVSSVVSNTGIITGNTINTINTISPSTNSSPSITGTSRRRVRLCTAATNSSRQCSRLAAGLYTL